jgi:uncharacterized lipoprotein YbaY
MSSNHTPPLVTGSILLSQELSSFSGATATVYLEDVSLVDAPAQIITKQVIPNVSHKMGTENKIEFALFAEIPNPRARYSIRVQVTLHDDQSIHRGDYITMESYPVLTFGYPNRVSVLVQEVK